MGLYDLLYKHKISYNKLVELIGDLSGCADFNAEQIVKQLDELYDDDEYKRFVNYNENNPYKVIYDAMFSALNIIDTNLEPIECERETKKLNQAIQELFNLQKQGANDE